MERLADQTKLAKIAVEVKDSDVRHAAVDKLTDQALLAKFAVGDNDWQVRRAAVNKLSDQALLAKCAAEAKDADIRRASVGKLADQALLAKFAAEDKDPEVCKAAVARLTDQTLMTRTALAAKAPVARFAAMRKLTDQAVLAWIAVEDQDPDVRHGALVKLDVTKLNDQPLLARIAVEAKNSDVRRVALAKLTDQGLLATMGMWVKPELTRGVMDQALLAKIALEAQDAEVRRAAVLNLTNQDLLAKAAADHSDLELRYAALAKLTDQAVLAEIALKDEDIRARLAAVQNLTNQHVLYLVATKEDILSVLGINRPGLAALSQFIVGAGQTVPRDETLALKRAAIAGLTDQTALADIVTKLKDPELRCAAIERLTDQEVLAKIATENLSFELRIVAIGKLTDQILLRNLIQFSPQAAIRQAAVRRITDDTVLLRRLPQEPSAAVRAAIVATLLQARSLQQVGQTAYHEVDRRQALERLQQFSRDETAVVKNSHAVLANQILALAAEDDPARLLHLVLDGEFDVLRIAAAQRLTDPATIEQIATQAGGDHEVIAIVLAKLEDKAALNRVAASAKDRAMRVAATRKTGVSWDEIFRRATTGGKNAQTLGDALAAVALFPEKQLDAVEGVQQACLNLIRLGNESRIPEMVDLLEGYGDKTLAEDYLNCGQPDLDIAGRAWATRRGYNVSTGSGSHRANWGSGR